MFDSGHFMFGQQYNLGDFVSGPNRYWSENEIFVWLQWSWDASYSERYNSTRSAIFLDADDEKLFVE